MPGVFSSVAPSGIPAEVDDGTSGDEDVPSGEVAPIPGVEADCACAAATPRQMKTDKTNRDRIESSEPIVALGNAESPSNRAWVQLQDLFRKHTAREASSLTSPRVGT
jgi:hypothetical protein